MQIRLMTINDYKDVNKLWWFLRKTVLATNSGKKSVLAKEMICFTEIKL